MKQVTLTPTEVSYTLKALQFLKDEVKYGYNSESIKYQDEELGIINQILSKLNRR